MCTKIKRTCKLCLKTIYDNNYESLEGDNKQILEVLVLKVDVKSSEKCIVCIHCLEMLQKCFEFKSRCLDVEDFITPFIKSDTKVDIRRVLQETMEIIDDNIKLCRLCIDIVKNDTYKQLNQNESQELVDNIRNCLPELNINAVNNPLICEKCINCLDEYSSFQKKCRDSINFSDSTDEMINAVSTEYVKLEDIDIKSEPVEVVGEPSAVREKKWAGCNRQKASRNTNDNYGRNANSKTELSKDKARAKIDIYKCTVCKYGTKYQKWFNKHLLTHLNPPEKKIYKCDVCDYTSHYKTNLRNHILVHKDFSEVDIYKCNECQYKSKLKGSLVHHILTHRNSSQVKMHKCTRCNFTTKYKNSLEGHKLRHVYFEEGMYKCDQCAYTTHWKYQLESHTLTHKN